MQLINNHNNVEIIKYQSPIPSGGPIYNQNTSDVQARMSYYSVPFAPYGRIDGKVVMEPAGQPSQNRGHVRSEERRVGKEGRGRRTKREKERIIEEKESA